jgi:hypothetical protein
VAVVVDLHRLFVLRIVERSSRFMLVEHRDNVRRKSGA